MKRAALLCAVAAFGTSAAAANAVPTLKSAVLLDGKLTELKPLPDSDQAVGVEAALAGSSLWVGARAPTAPVGAHAQSFELWLHFKDAGLGARPFLFVVTDKGVEAPASPEAAPKAALAGVRSAWSQADEKTGNHPTQVELLIPARSLPRFPNQAPLRLELCATFHAEGGDQTSCSDFDRPTEIELSNEILPALSPPPRPSVGLEGRKDGWAAFGEGLLPISVWSDRRLTAPILTSLTAENPVELKTLGLEVPDRALSPRKRPLLAILDGRDPFDADGQCSETETLRLGLYELDGKAARQVLEAPAAGCTLGRARTLVIEDQGNGAELRILYSSGQVVSFIWSEDHYERTEYGQR